MSDLRWRPRGSSVGNYFDCEYRAANDRAVAEGQVTLDFLVGEPEPRSTAAMSLGSCIHYELQDGLRSIFAPKDMRWLDSAEDETELENEFYEICDRCFGGNVDACVAAHHAGDPRVYQPPPETYADASETFGKNMAVTQEQIRAAAALGAPQVPKSPDGKPWICETLHENAYVTGHSDFWSQDGSVIGDLKTTAKPPYQGWIKTQHYGQMAVYHNLTRCRLSWVLYVDSTHAKWTNLVWIDWTKPGPQEYAKHIEEYCKYLCSEELFTRAVPRLGPHCGETWCPYKRRCHDRMIPAKGHFVDNAAAKKPTGPMTWGGRVVGG